MRTIGIIIFLISITSCNTTEPPDNLEPALKLELEDVSCTEAWITLTTANLQLPTTITLKQNEETIETINLSETDTLLYIDSLLPNLTYTFKATCHSGLSGISSNELTVTTMDTTSHNFTWQTFTFGEKSNSVLYDVAIVNENCILAVGEIYTLDSYTYDSLGNWIDPYNAVYWNGTKWELKRIYYKYNGSNLWGPIRTIYAFNENDIWFGTNIHWNGQVYEQPNTSALIGWSANKLWGSSSNDLYAVGNNGNIAHYNGSGWTKIESGTDVDLIDLWGTPDGSIIWASGYSLDRSKSILLKIINNSVIKEWENNEIAGTLPYGNLIHSIYYSKNNLFLSTNQGIFRDKINIEFYSQNLHIVPRRVYKITGTNPNDIYTVGDRTNVWHFNGMSWKELYVNLSVISPLYSAATRDNVFIGVGTIVLDVVFHKAQIIIGKGN